MTLDDGLSHRPDFRFQALFEQAPFSVQLLAPDGRTLRVNKAWEAMWQASADDGLKHFVLTEYNILDDPQLEEKGITPYLRRAFAGESVTLPVIVYEPRELHTGGRARWVRAQAHPLKDETGQVCEVMLIHEDVSSQMEAEQAVRSSELRLRQLANTIPQLVWIAEADGSIHWYNERWYDYTGTTPEQMQGWGWQSVHDPEQLPEVVARWKHSLSTGEPIQMTFPLRGRDGRFRPFFTVVAPLKDSKGEVLQWFGTNTDVSALHDAEVNLRQAEERLRLAVRAGNIGIWDWDVARDVVDWSEPVHEQFGIAPGEFGGHFEDFAARVHADDRDTMRRRVEAALAGDDEFSAEFRVLRPDGQTRWLSTWARLHRDPAGAPARMIGATISIDAYKRAEEALREGDRRKDEFLAMLAHELRNPLAPIGAAARLLQSPAAEPPLVRQASEIIARQVKHMTQLVDDLLDVSRVTRGRIELQRGPVALGSIIADAVEQARPTLESRRHRLAIAADVGGARVDGDGTRLVQALVNLLDNAAKYTADGGLVTLAAHVTGDQATVAVEDTGEGIEAALLPRVFELFTQGGRSAARTQGGLGIGLALVRGIVERHGGRVEAHSAGPGAGSAFRITLPLLPEDAASLPDDTALPPVEPAPPAPAVDALDIVVVDDNEDAARALEALLDLDGHRVAVHHDARSILDALGDRAPQAFILDIGLPDMNGYELARRLRERAPDSLYIALTGYGQAEDRRLSRDAGFDHHLVKPVDYGLLSRLLGGAG